MTNDQLALDIERVLDEVCGPVELVGEIASAPAPRAPVGRVFTALMFAATCPNRTAVEARSLLTDFAEVGVVARVPGGFQLTAKGRSIACDLAFAAGPEDELE